MALFEECQSESLELASLSRCLEDNREAAFLKDEDGATPLHVLCSNESVTRAALETLLGSSLVTLLEKDEDGATPLHLLCSNTGVTVELVRCCLDAAKVAADTLPAEQFKEYAEAFARLMSETDAEGDTALFALCQNEACSPALLDLALSEVEDGASVRNANGDSPLHYLCSSECVSEALIKQLMAADPAAIRATDETFGDTPLHCLCGNEALKVKLFDAYLAAAGVQAATVRNTHGRNPLHSLAENASITSRLVRAFLVACPTAWTEEDEEGHIPAKVYKSYVATNAAQPDDAVYDLLSSGLHVGAPPRKLAPVGE